MKYILKKLKTKVGISIVILILASLVIGLSYGTFVITTDKYKASELLISNLIYGIDIKTTSGSETIKEKTVSTTNTSTVLVTITSLNNIDSKYSLEYKITNGSGKIYYASSTGWYPTGKLSKDGGEIYKKTIKVVIEPEGDITVDFNVAGGYAYINEYPTLKDYTRITEEYKQNINYEEETNLKDIVINDTECKNNICTYGGEATNNYLQYPTDKTNNENNIWRIIGSYSDGIKIISNITTTTSPSEINSSLTSFYNTLEKPNEYITNTNKFNCNSLGCQTSNYTNIGLITTYEYTSIGGLNSYLKNENNFYSLNNETIENITPLGIEETNETTISGLRAVVYLQNDINVTGSGTITNPYRIYSKGKTMTIKYTIKGSPVNIMPTKEEPYIVNTVTCTNGAQGIWDETNETVKLTKEELPTTCTVDFKEGYTVALTSTTASISAPASKVVGRTGETSFTVTAKEGYTLENGSVSCTNNATGSITGSTVTITNIKTNTTCTLTAVVLPKVTLTVTNGSGGGTKTVSIVGGNTTFTITPNTGYTLEGATVSGTGCSLSGNTLTASNVTSDRTCTVTLAVAKKTLYDQILVDHPTVNTRSSFSSVFGSGTATTGVIYKESTYREDTSTSAANNKDVYYFAGNVADNWVKFAGKYWRIIRTNEDGGIRLLYHGTSTTATDSYIQTSYAYNPTYNNTMYVGYMYGSTGSLANNRNNTTSPQIKTKLESWYSSDIASYDNAVSKTAIYCNDRAGDAYAATGTMYYAAYKRLIDNKRPTYKCGGSATSTSLYGDVSSADRFSKSTASGGNGQLSQPIGLMTADEVAFAGGVYGTNSPYAYYYLNSSGGSSTGSYWWWTMSPSRFDGSSARVFFVHGSDFPGYLNYVNVYNTGAVRPVLSLKSCVLVSKGNGTASSPYEIEVSSACATSEN